MFGKPEKPADPVCEALCIVADAFRFESTVATAPVATACTALAARLDEAVKARKLPAIETDHVVVTDPPGTVAEVTAELKAGKKEKL